MTKQQYALQALTSVTYANQMVDNCQQLLAEASACQLTAHQQAREALFDLYVSGSHRSFVKFLKQNATLICGIY